MITYLLLFALGIIWAGWGYVAGRVHGHSRHLDRFSANDLRLIFGRDS